MNREMRRWAGRINRSVDKAARPAALSEYGTV
jgi:hypothetical protein